MEIPTPHPSLTPCTVLPLLWHLLITDDQVGTTGHVNHATCLHCTHIDAYTVCIMVYLDLYCPCIVIQEDVFGIRQWRVGLSARYPNPNSIFVHANHCIAEL